MRGKRWYLGIGSLALACLLVLACVVFTAGCGSKASLPQGEGTPPATHTVKIERNIPYFTGPGSVAAQNSLDLYSPEGASNFPVVVFVHGGAWTAGDKQLGEPLGNTLAARGIGVASINYRLAPVVQNPEQARDVARAFAWVHANIKARGGDPDTMFLSGHSAGGQLAALVGLDQSYLKEQNLDTSILKGVFPLSGVYDMQALGQIFGTSIADIFGSGSAALTAASPLDLVRADAPPFLILWGQFDLPTLPEQATNFLSALQRAGAPASGAEMAERFHSSILADIGTEGDPTTDAIFNFLRPLATFK